MVILSVFVLGLMPPLQMTLSSDDDTPIVSPNNLCSPMDENRRIIFGDTRFEQCDVMDLSVQIQRCDTWNQLAEISVRGLCSLMGAVDVRWTEVAADGNRALWACSSSEEHSEYLRNNLDAMLQRTDELGVFHKRIVELLQEHSDEILQLKGLLSPEGLRNNSYVRDFLTPVGVADIVSIQVFLSNGGVAIVCMAIPEGQVSTQQMKGLKFLQQHIRLACKKLSRLVSYTNLTDTLTQLRERGKLVGISVLSQDGEKLWESDDVSVDILKELGGNKDEEGCVHMSAEMALWAKEVLTENIRVCAQTVDYSKVFQTEKGVDIQVSLLLERAGSGGLLVVKRDKKSGDYGGVFTRRELDVIHSINQGMSSQEVSEKLHISKRTVDKHLENVYGKLGVNNRISALKRLEQL